MVVAVPDDAASLPAVLAAPGDYPALAVLLESRVPARVAWVAPDGGPRVAPMWFSWNGRRLVVTAFAGAAKLQGLTVGARVAVSVDTDDFPYRSLSVKAVVSDVRPADGLTAEYEAAAARYLGPGVAAAWCEALAGADQVNIELQPTSAVVSDLGRDSAFFAHRGGAPAGA